MFANACHFARWAPNQGPTQQAPTVPSPHLALVAQGAADAWHQHLSRHRLGWLQEVGQTCREEVEVGGEGASTMGFSEGIQEKELAGEVV